MRIAIIIAVTAALTTPALGQEPTIVDTCLRVVEIETGRSDLITKNVQSFPELTPPRIQADYGRAAAEKRTLAAILDEAIDGRPDDEGFIDLGSIRCEFESPTAPFVLRDFNCSCRVWFTADERQMRLEEINALLAREGF